MSSLKEALQEVRETLERGWTQGTYARDQKGEECSILSLDASCFCLTGAIKLFYKKGSVTPVSINTHLYSILRKKYCFADSLAAWNDVPGRTKAQILSLLDLAIDQASSCNK